MLKLELTVWGGNGRIKGRYTDVAAFYRQVGDTQYHRIDGTRVSQDVKTEVYQFATPPLPTDAKGELEYYFEMKFDGQLNHTAGLKKIRIEPF